MMIVESLKKVTFSYYMADNIVWFQNHFLLNMKLVSNLYFILFIVVGSVCGVSGVDYIHVVPCYRPFTFM